MQKFNWNQPEFTFEEGYMCTVHFNGKSFQGEEFRKNKKEAEQDAAKLAIEYFEQHNEVNDLNSVLPG